MSDVVITDADPKPSKEPRIFFSVLVCAWNCAEYIDECLDSLLAQTFPSWECLVLDDASTDGTLDRIKAKVGDDPRFRIYANDVRATALPNLMFLIREAKGDYIALLDGDDYLTQPEALDIVFAVYNDAPNVWVTSGSYVRVPDNVRGHVRPMREGETWWTTWLFGHLLTWRRQLSLDSFEQEPESYIDIETGQPYRAAYDIPLTFAAVARAEQAGKRVAHINHILYAYRRHPLNEDVADAAAYQGRCAMKVSIFWGNKIVQWEAMASQ